MISFKDTPAEPHQQHSAQKAAQTQSHDQSFSTTAAALNAVSLKRAAKAVMEISNANATGAQRVDILRRNLMGARLSVVSPQQLQSTTAAGNPRQEQSSKATAAASQRGGGSLTLASLKALPFVQAIQNIFEGKDLETFLSDLSTSDLVDYITHHYTHIQSDDRKLSLVGQRLANIGATSEEQAPLSTVRFRDAMLSLAVSAKKVETVFWIATAMMAVSASAHNTRLFSYRPLRNALVHLAWQAKSPPTIEVVCSLFARFGEVAAAGYSGGEGSGGGDLLLFSTPAVRDAFVCMADYAVSSSSIVAWATALLHLMANGKEGERAFTVAEIRTVIYKVARSVDSIESMVALTGLITSFVFSLQGKQLMNSRVTVETMLHLAEYASAAEAVESWCRALLHFASIEENRHLCMTKTIHDGLVQLAPFAETCGAIEWFCRLVAGLALSQEVEALLCTREIRRALRQLSTITRHIVNSVRLQKSRVTSKLVSPRDPQLSPVVYDSDDANSEHAATNAALWICNVIINLTSSSDAHKARFSHEDVRDLLLDLSILLPTSLSREVGGLIPPLLLTVHHSTSHHHPTTPPPALITAMSHVVYNITRFVEKPHLFAVRPFRSLLFALSRDARNSATVLYLLGSIVAITVDDENRIACGDGKMKDCLVTLADVVSGAEAALRWWKSISQICVLEVNRSNFSLGDEMMIKALLKCMRASKSPEAVVAMGKAMDVLFSSHYRDDDNGRHRMYPSSTPGIFSSPAGRSISPPLTGRMVGDLGSSSGGTLGQVLSTSSHLRASSVSPNLTAAAYGLPVTDLRDALLAVRQHATTGDAVSWMSRSLFALAIANGGDQGQFGCSQLCTREVHDAVVFLAQHASHSDAVRWLCKFLNLLGRDYSFRELLASKNLQRALLSGCKPHARTSDAVQFLSDALSLVTKCIEDATFSLEGNSEEGLGVTLDKVKEPRQRVYGSYFYQAP